MLGTFAGPLDARKINAKEGRLNCEVRGEVQDESSVLVITRCTSRTSWVLKIPMPCARRWNACTGFTRRAVRFTAPSALRSRLLRA